MQRRQHPLFKRWFSILSNKLTSLQSRLRFMGRGKQLQIIVSLPRQAQVIYSCCLSYNFLFVRVFSEVYFCCQNSQMTLLSNQSLTWQLRLFVSFMSSVFGKQYFIGLVFYHKTSCAPSAGFGVLFPRLVATQKITPI